LKWLPNRLLKSFKIFLFAKERRNPKVANIAFNHKIAQRYVFFQIQPSCSTVKSSAVCSSFRWYWFYAPKGLSFLSPVRYNLRLRNSFYI
jgi:hypothetical protein